MKIKTKRSFRYQVSATKVKELQPGTYEVGVDISQNLADSAMRFFGAEVVVEPVVVEPVVEKVAPENKVVEVAENKSRVAKKPVRRRSNRTKPDK